MDTAGGIISAYAIAYVPTWWKIEVDDILVSPIAARRHPRYQGCIRCRGGEGLTALWSTLLPRRSEILSNSYNSFPSPLLLLPVPHLRHCRWLHLPVSPYPMLPLSWISTAANFCRPYPPLNLSAIPILSCISSASVVILPHLRCSPHRIVFHRPVSFNAVIFLCVSYLSIS